MDPEHPPVPLLERDQEIASLQGAWRAARGGRGSTWFLCAEAGGGKTCLATEFARACGARTLWGAAEPVSPPEPYLAVSRALSGFAPAPSRAGSVASAIEALQQAAGAAPVILVLEDLHFADEGTVAVVVRLSATCASQPWLILATYRPSEGPSGLLAPFAEVAAQGLAQRVDLAPLSPAAVATLVAGVRGAPVSTAEAETIYAGSGGNPWFAEVLARGAVALSVARDRINLRLDRLEQAQPGSLRVLEALAPATHPLPHPVVGRLRGGDTRDLRRTLGLLRGAGVLHEGGDGWGFRHELLRRSLLDGMISADRREAHQRLAEALEFRVPSSEFRAEANQPGTRNAELGTSRRVSAAELAMHYAAAADPRAVVWARAAAREAAAVDAHTEAMAQLERALAFELAPEERRETLIQASVEADAVGRFANSRRLAEEALAIDGGEPEMRARLHQLAARAAHHLGDFAADEAHLTAAERALAGRPVTTQTANIALARVARAALAVDPGRLAVAADHALAVARDLPDPDRAAWVAVVVRGYLAGARIDGGDPSGFTMLEAALREAAERRFTAQTWASALGAAYQGAVLALFHREAAGLYERVNEAIRRHDLGWHALVEPSRLLELVQRGRYEEVRTLAGTIAAPEPGSFEEAVLSCADALREARAGSLDRARAALPSGEAARGFQQAAFVDLIRIELAMLTGDAGLGELAQRVYGRMNRHRYARVAGVAAVGLARSGRGAPRAPSWLVADAPLRVLWQWAEGIEQRDAAALRDVATRLEAMHCPYEAALALRDAGDLGGAYRALRAIEATTVREQVAEELRARGQPIPRRSRSALDPDSLTETERQICRLVATGVSNEEVAARLTISVLTVAGHLTHIYRKTGCRGRTALAVWWSQRTGEATAP